MFQCRWPGDSARGLPGVLGSPTDPLCPRHTSNNPNRTVLPQWWAGRGWTLRSIDPVQTNKKKLWRNGHESMIHWIMPHDARISRDSLCHGKCMEGVGKTWEVARESADGDYCHFDYLTVEDEDDNDVDDDDDDWGLACTFPTEIFPVFCEKATPRILQQCSTLEGGWNMMSRMITGQNIRKPILFFPHCQQLLDLGD